ncbi:ectonucleoside triphosphate diphosphohydrolase 3 [Denticeps clupeoides]|uniref:Ectonucleoside triphosphate diphosphohydrolase 3 n=1 Tax=Denticeps clupeoides TaxID=299321 RepID=A0AAY4DE29_9TELE|nr:ectonucleoside triphosphate diphosphohydrolase 3 [Denticeps clupeoides]
MATKTIAALATFLLLASAAVIITISVIQTHHARLQLKYGIVLDCGSSRTTVYVYRWPADKENNTGVVSETHVCNVNGSGISDWSNMTLNKLGKCMKEVEEHIPSSQHKTTPVYLGATAGMRLLHLQNESASNEILLNLKNYLKTLPFQFKNVSIISGEEEGLYGWITVNYLMNNFLERNLWNAWVRPHAAQTVGSLDLGGASTQIAFATPDDEAGEGQTQITLYGYKYNVYTHSYLCYGKNEAEKAVLANLVQMSKDKRNVLNPCYPSGYNTTKRAKSIFGSNCTKNPTNYDPEQIIALFGTGNVLRCREAVRSIFDLQSSCENCSFNGVHQPPVSGKFKAYAGFFYTSDALNLTATSSLDQFNRTIWDFCSLDHKSLLQTKLQKKHLHSYCYSANYIYTLLKDGYKFNADTWQDIDFQSKVNNTSIAWTLGYMLALSNMIPAEAKFLLPMKNDVFAGLLFLFSALTIVALITLLIILVRTCY